MKNTLSIVLRTVLTSLILLACIQLQAQTSIFSPREQQSISCETPGLFSRSQAFSVDFGQISAKDYSFPLPVGKVLGTRKNNNIIISTTKGDAVKAMFSGTVRLSRNLPQWGNTIVIRHDNGLETVYGNNAQNLVSVGQKVKAGESVAIAGTRQDKTYCEFCVLVNGARMNPETLIDTKSHRLRRHTLLFEKQNTGVKITVVNEEQKVTGKGSKATSQGAANTKYAKNSEHHAQPQDDSEPLDIDEFQSIAFEKEIQPPFKHSNEFSINFAEYGEDDFCYPMKGGRVISSYGGKRRHAGTDIKTKAGDPVYAAFEGKVTLSGRHYGYGLCIVIRHANGLETLYSHQSKNMVKVGDWVKAGQQIGIVGRTGRATTEHVHFEVKCNGRPFDSAKIIDHKNRWLKKQTFVFRKSGKGGVTITAKQ